MARLMKFDPLSDRITASKKRLAAAYAREECGCIPVVDPNVNSPGYSPKEVLDDLDKMLESSVSWANSLAAADQDWPPFINTYCTIPMVAEAFGCEVIFSDAPDAWVRHAISNIEQVWRIKPISKPPLIKRNSAWIDYAQRKLGTDVPFWTLDVQSPFSVAALIVEPEELMISLITNPKPVHHLLRMITDYSIKMMQEHLSQMDHPGYPGRNFPSISDNIGVCIADDTPLIMLNPEMYREFALPYNSEIGAFFGGVHIHSCGEYSHNLDSLLDTTNIRSIQLHAGEGEFRLPESPEADHPFNRARNRLAYFVDVNDVCRGDSYAGKPKSHFEEYVLPRLCRTDMTGCILQSCGAGEDLRDSASALSWTRQRLDHYSRNVDSTITSYVFSSMGHQ